MPEYDEAPIGYQSPPKRNQFRKGKSGNPRGRPRKADGIEDNLSWLLALPVRVSDTGEQVTMFSALIRVLHRLVVNGDLQAMKLMERVTKKALKYNLIDLPPVPKEEDPLITMSRAVHEALEEEKRDLCPEEDIRTSTDQDWEHKDE